MTCWGCEQAARDICAPCFVHRCPECDARHLAHSQSFYVSIRSNTIDPTYRAALQYCFGSDWKAVHEKVKEYAEKITNAKETQWNTNSSSRSS